MNLLELGLGKLFSKGNRGRRRGSALDDLRAFPVGARREAGYQLDQLQQGRLP
ncbi:hypothetical protein [Thiocapsa rosea]|uniref:hypothetical protein n=1 Tax=Thiocapsa rosea TaxID=69360 RepID=UPI0014730B04|nr:hypothetical protein [Thiocapsa rosea]